LRYGKKKSKNKEEVSGDKCKKGGDNDADRAEKDCARIESMGRGATAIVTCTGGATAIT
jgi:hypothetical protein